jgi:hypothetical protein
VRRGNPVRSAGKDVERFALPAGHRLAARLHPCSGHCGDPSRLVRVGPVAPCLRRQHRGNRRPDAGAIVFGGPSRKVDDIGRDERFRVEHLADRFDVLIGETARAGADTHHDARHCSRTERDNDSRADDRRNHPIGHPVRQQIERGDGNRDKDEQ